LKSSEPQVNAGGCSLLSYGLTVVIIGVIFMQWCDFDTHSYARFTLLWGARTSFEKQGTLSIGCCWVLSYRSSWPGKASFSCHKCLEVLALND
jgi:hypothetical protein